MKLVLLTVLLSLLAIGASLKCYQCNPCASGEKGELTECSSNNATCMTIISKSNSITKSCSEMSACNETCKGTPKSEKCTCCDDKDGCNDEVSTSVSNSISTLAILAPVVATVIFYD